ncbi:MAG: hypothetical protein JSW23_05890 [Planctomycetota bacterium]|nr:MAG: hypothetical protein JSW23_05890 [Planctomycetota bacterium]
MADNDSSIIKPVESLQNIGTLKPVKRREERKRRQYLQEQKSEQFEQQPDDSADQQNLAGQSADQQANGNPDDTGIDYCA